MEKQLLEKIANKLESNMVILAEYVVVLFPVSDMSVGKFASADLIILFSLAIHLSTA